MREHYMTAILKNKYCGLLEKDLITQWQVGQSYWYDLAISENDTVDNKTVSENDTTKESNKRNNIKKLDERLKPYIFVSALLYNLHHKVDEKYLEGKNVPAICEKWANDIRLLVEKDGRTIAEIEQVIKWVKTEGNFWFVNIMSGKKLRLQFPKLILQMKQEGRKPGSFKGTDKELHGYDEFFNGG